MLRDALADQHLRRSTSSNDSDAERYVYAVPKQPQPNEDRGVISSFVETRSSAKGRSRPWSLNRASEQRMELAASQPQYERARRHEEVRTKPLRALALTYDYRDVALGKACRKLNIPSPPIQVVVPDFHPLLNY